ncbi:MAG: ankyrin repeat domain-containing protein [Ottowia sp.]|nr:ankyrin repeat domain-containing protein [Ottowia sp.]
MKAEFKMNAKRILPPLFLLIFSLVFINTAWLCDDIFITFRAVDNFLKGYGPVWNVGERVQVYTHPLWYALLVIGIGIFKHHYWFTLALSYACLLGTLLLFLKIARHGNMVLAMLASVALLLSRAFADYSSSGLENPLLHLLLCAYVLVAISQQDAARRFLYTGLLYNLLFLTRPDAIFLVTPASLWMLWQASKACGWRRTLKLALLAAAPALAWEAFSLIYYGSLVPNTAIAKTNLGYPRSEMLARGWDYMKVCLLTDPITLGTILLAFPLAATLGKGCLPRLLMGGVALQLVYICWVGGDYMAGRFLTGSLLTSALAIALSSPPESAKAWLQAIGKTVAAKLPSSHKSGRTSLLSLLGVVILLFIITLVIPRETTANIRYLSNYSLNSLYSPKLIAHDRNNKYGVNDERGYYYSAPHALGLMHIITEKKSDPYTSPWTKTGGRLAENNLNDTMLARRVIGQPGWAAGHKPYIVDALALSDPFLAHLPALLMRDTKSGRVARTGHYTRAIPQGYIQTLITGKNTITHPAMAALYDDVALAARAPLFSAERWKSIWRLNTGFHRISLDDCAKHSDDFDFINYFARARVPYLMGQPPAFSPFAEKSDSPNEGGVSRLKRTLVHGDGTALATLLAAPAAGEPDFKKTLTQASSELWYFLLSETENGQGDKLKALLDHGVDVEAPDPNGFRPLEIAAALNYVKAAKALLGAGADVNTIGQYNETALSLALAGSHTNLAKILLDDGADADVALLIAAPLHGRTHSISFLLEHGANVNARTATGKTALQLAAANGHTGAVNILKSAGGHE